MSAPARGLTVRTLQSMVWTGGGVTAELALQAVIVMVLARLLVPADFGIVTVALVVTGVVQTWRVLPGGLGDLTSTDYGRTLLVKLVFVAALVALGGGSRRLVARRLLGPPLWRGGRPVRGKGRDDGPAGCARYRMVPPRPGARIAPSGASPSQPVLSAVSGVRSIACTSLSESRRCPMPR